MEPATPSLAWKWILEQLLDFPDIGLPFFDGVISSHISDLEEPHCGPLRKRVALRVLKEMIDRNQFDSDAIPLLKVMTGQILHWRSMGLSIKQRFDKELVLRVQTEIVLSVLRKGLDEGEKDWAFYESELERVFGEAEEDNRLLDRKWELRALLEPMNQTKVIVSAYFGKFSLSKLRLDLRSLIKEKREALDTMFLDQLSRDFLDANGKPFSEDLGGVEKSTKGEENGKQDHVGIVNVERLQEIGERDYQYLGQNPKVSVIEDQHMVPGTPIVSGKKRRWEHLSTQNAIGDDESEEADEGLAGMKKSRKSPATPIVNPQCVSELPNGSGRGHPQGIVETEVVKETIVLQREREILVDRRKEASTGSSEVNGHQQEDSERFVTKNEFKSLDSQDIYEVDFLEVGSDGHEEVCRICGKHGKLLWCEGCPMSMHFDCIKDLGLRLPKSEDWRCPICLLLKAEREAAEAEKVAVAAKDKLQAFEMESKKRKSTPLRHSRQENAIRQSSLRISSLQSEENDRVLKPNQESDEEPNLGSSEGQHFNLTGPALFEAYLRSSRCKLPGRRRTSLPWTREEEEVLKKGVYLSRNGAWGVNRWSRILEFGQGVFDPSRNSVDVKDKMAKFGQARQCLIAVLSMTLTQQIHQLLRQCAQLTLMISIAALRMID